MGDDINVRHCRMSFCDFVFSPTSSQRKKKWLLIELRSPKSESLLIDTKTALRKDRERNSQPSAKYHTHMIQKRSIKSLNIISILEKRFLLFFSTIRLPLKRNHKSIWLRLKVFSSFCMIHERIKCYIEPPRRPSGVSFSNDVAMQKNIQQRWLLSTVCNL